MRYPLLDAFLTVLYFFLWILWIWLVIYILFDIFRSHDLSGWAKALWTIFIIFLPLIGVLVYLIVRGSSIHERRERDVQAQDRAFRAYVRDAASDTGGTGRADELAKLADLHERGVITDAEFEQGKAKVLSS
jgi:archaellum biogenesis protein FlaJ (TadC family)